MGPLEAIVFLDASCYFWTRRGISARVHNERAAGRAGGRGKDGKTISGHVFGRAGGQADRLAKLFLDASCYFWTRRGISARVHNERAAGRAGGRGKDGKIISGHVFGRAGRLPKLFLDTSSAKLFLGTSPGGRPGGQAAKVISGHVFSKIISGHVSGRAGGRTGWQSYFWTRLAISGRVVEFLHAFITSGRPGGRAGEGRMAKLFLDTSSGGRADRLPKLFLDTSSAKLYLGTSPGGRAGGRGKATKVIAFCVAGARFWKLLV